MTSTVLPTAPRTVDAAAAPVRTRLRLTRRGRAVFSLLGAIPLAAVLAGGILNGGEAVAAGEAGAGRFSYVTVEAGDSLWSVAESIAPGADPREVVADLVRFNSLGSSSLQAGQQLAVPVGYSG